MSSERFLPAGPGYPRGCAVLRSATLLLLGLVVVSVSARAQQYAVTEIPKPTVPAGIATAPPTGLALNASGEVTGQYAAQPFYDGSPTGAYRLFVYRDRSTMDLGSDNPFGNCGTNGAGPAGLGIDAAGDITGSLCGRDEFSIAFVMLENGGDYGQYVPFNSVIQAALPNLVGAVGNAINANGQVAGTIELPNGTSACSETPYRPFLYDSRTGAIQDLSERIQLIGGCSAQALAISDFGQVAGYFTDAGGISHAYVYSSSTGAAIDIGNLGGTGTFAQATAISSNGQMVTGYSQSAGNNPEAFLYVSGAMQAVGDLGGVKYSVGNGVNSGGQVTGKSLAGISAVSHAFLYSKGAGIQDLNSLISSTDAAFYTLVNGVAINDAGQILVLATQTATGQQVTLLLTPVTAVPNVVGDTQPAATSALTAAGFVLGAVTMQGSTTVAPGFVISQDPAAGASVESGSAVNLVVSSGVAVPNVVGVPLAMASNELTSAGLATGSITQQYSGTVAPGTVISESPSAGSSVAGGAPVDLVVSQGAAPVEVPNLLGDSQAAAAAALSSASLSLGTVGQQASSSVPPGEVLSQSPAAGDSVSVGSVVNVILSSGPAQVSIALAAAPRFANTGSAWSVVIDLRNNGNVTATITSLFVTFGGVSSPDLVIGNLPPGGERSVAATFPATVTSGVLKLSGTYSAGTLSGNWNISARVAVPAVP